MTKRTSFLFCAGVLLLAGAALAADGTVTNTTPPDGSIATVAQTLRSTFADLASLITGAAYVAGFGFSAAAIVKFKAHKDNPTQIPVGTPIALLFVGAALIFLPYIFSVGGATLFGSDATSAGPLGTSDVYTIGGGTSNDDSDS